MMPLTMAKEGDAVRVIACNSNGKVKEHLGNLGILPGKNIKLITQQDGNLVVKVEETRLALNRGMANSIIVE